MINDSNSLKTEFLKHFSCNPPGWLPETLKGTYEFLEQLSEKEDRCVYLVRNRENGEKCVMKITNVFSADNAAREYELLNKLSHISIPRAIHFEKDGVGRSILIRSYAEGATLSALVERDGPFSARQTMEITDRLCKVMSYLHRQTPPVIYKDVKPLNVILTPNGKITLIDFGISREYSQQKATDTQIIGSFDYASPEHLGFKSTDMRSDIFSVGRLISYLSTGNAFTLPKDTELAKIIKRCTNLEPGKRYHSMEQLSRTLEKVLNPPSRKEIGVTFAVIMTIILAGFIFFWNMIRIPAPVVQERPIYANAQENNQNVLKPVNITVVNNGKASADCAVSADNHHWFIPDKSGKATLEVLPFGGYNIIAATGNQQVSIPAGDLTTSEVNEFILDLKDAPSAPELIELAGTFGEQHVFPIDLNQVEEVVLSGQPVEITAENRDGQWVLVVTDAIKQPGHYGIFLTGKNKHGKVDSMIHLHLEEEKPLVMISTASELDAMRNDLDGNYALANDIDLTSIPDWVPVGTGEYPFTGTFDGRGFHLRGLKITRGASAGLFGYTRLAAIRNLILIEPSVHIVVESYTGVGGIVGIQNSGIVENCAVLGGTILADIGFEGGAAGIVGINLGGIERALFNSATVIIENNGSRQETDSSAGGVVGTNSGYLTQSANSGTVRGISLVGGVTAFTDDGLLTRCYNVGRLQGDYYVQNISYPPGGVTQLLGRGRLVAYSAFETSTATKGATVWNGGTLLGLVPLDAEALKDLAELERVFKKEKGESGFVLNESISPWPVPIGIFN